MSSMDTSVAMTPVTFLSSSHIPQHGTLIPNRIFVGGIPNDTTESELKHFFSTYGPVRDCKIILDRVGLSKSYGFVTFELQEDAEKIIRRTSESLVLRDRKLNIGPAIRKQGPSRYYGGMQDEDADQNVSPANALVYPNSATTAAASPYSMQNGMTFLCSSDGYLIQAQPQTAVYSNLMSSYYSPRTYFGSPQAAAPAQWANPSTGQWRWASPNHPTSMMSPGQYVYPVQMAVMPTEIVYTPAPMQMPQQADTGDV